VIIAADGSILTNNHVVATAQGSTVQVTFNSGKTATATIVGTDPTHDLAVIKVSGVSGLTPITFADSGTVKVGDTVLAVGSPLGLDGSVTSGIVSALNREITAPDDTPIEGAIQTDAAINHGNSGGPLLNLQGQVIGVTSQIQSDSGGNDGVGFAVPSNTVSSIASQLISTGKAQHALLGVSVKTASSGGVTVSAVSAGSGAASAGLKAGDVITAVDGTKVATAEKLRAIIAGDKPGDKITLTITRNGSSQTLTATLGSKT
jgi:putative serine protease PepD